jgi:hypothetical protein
MTSDHGSTASTGSTVTSTIGRVVVAGLLGAFGDFTFALAYYGRKLSVFQNVAAGIIGIEAAHAGGVTSYVLGVMIHFAIGGVWATLYWTLTRYWPVLLRRPVLGGLAYGVVVFYGMYQIVLPLSALHTPAWPPRWMPVDSPGAQGARWRADSHDGGPSVSTEIAARDDRGTLSPEAMRRCASRGSASLGELTDAARPVRRRSWLADAKGRGAGGATGEEFTGAQRLDNAYTP